MNNKYDDIINLPHHTSLKHPRMSIESRSAQFAPFSALSGYGDAIKETARLTDERIEIDDSLKEILNNKLQIIEENIFLNPNVTFTYYIPDSKKSGGKYVTHTYIVKKVDSINEIIITVDNQKIPMKEIIDISSDILNLYDNE